MMRIKKLKMQDKVSIRKAVTYMLGCETGKWWTPLQMQAIMWRIGAKMKIEEVHSVMDDIYEDSKDNPTLNKYERNHHHLCYRCTAFFTPNDI